MDIAKLFASKNQKNSIIWKNTKPYYIYGNRYLPVNFIEFVNKEMSNNTCQSTSIFKNKDVMCLDAMIGSAYASLVKIYKKEYKVNKALIEVMQYFAYNTTLVTLSTFTQTNNGVIVVPAYPRILAEKETSTVIVDNVIYKQWIQADIDPEFGNMFNMVMQKFYDEAEFKDIMIMLLSKFPLAYNTISIQKIWKLIKENEETSNKIRCSLAIAWFAKMKVFFEPSTKDMGFKEEANSIFFNEKNDNIESFRLEFEEG
jgi:hypothetical protein